MAFRCTHHDHQQRQRFTASIVLLNRCGLCGGPNGGGCGVGDSGDAALQAAFEEVVAPAVERFAPDIILVRTTSRPL